MKVKHTAGRGSLHRASEIDTGNGQGLRSWTDTRTADELDVDFQIEIAIEIEGAE